MYKLLVSLQRDNGRSPELEHEHRNIENDVVKLDHFSVKEYLISSSILTSEDTACFHADPLIAHLTMAEISVSHLIATNDISMAYLNNINIVTGRREFFEPRYRSEFPLLGYSIMWYKHIQQADAVNASPRKSGEQRSEALAEATHLLRDKCHRLLSGNYPGSFKNWLVLFRASTNTLHCYLSSDESSPLLMASLLDLSDNVRRLLDDGANVDGDLETATSRPRLTPASDVRKHSPVYGAAIAGSLESLRLLLKEGATLDQSGLYVVVKMNSRREVEVLTTILEARPSLKITDDTIIASAENFHSKEFLNYILDNQKSLTKFQLEVIAKKYWSCPQRLDVLEKTVSYGKKLDCDGTQMLRAFLQSKLLYADLEIQILIHQYDPSNSMVQEIVSWVLQDEYQSRWMTKAILSHYKKAGVEVVFTPEMEIIRERLENSNARLNETRRMIMEGIWEREREMEMEMEREREWNKKRERKKERERNGKGKGKGKGNDPLTRSPTITK